MNLIITGATGFIGKNLLPAILNDKSLRKVLMIIKNIKKIDERILSDKRVKIIEVDLVKKDLPKISNYDSLIHLADIIPNRDGDTLNFSDNIRITENIIRNIILNGFIKKVIYTSTLDVYGKPASLPIREEHPLQPLTFYGISKFSNELLIKKASEDANTKFVILRLSQVYGIGEPVIKVIPLFIKKINRGEEIVLDNKGKIIRDWVYIKDVVTAIQKAIYFNSSGTFNIATGKGNSLNFLIDLLSAKIGKKPNVKFDSACRDPRPKIILSIEKAKKYLNYRPVFNLKEGINDYLN